jgi:CheY-like chemotaxis protein
MKKILLVDDNPNDIELMLNRLKENGYAIEFTDDGLYALSAIEMHQPDLVVLDIYMPQQEGAQTLIEIKKKYPSLKVVIMSCDGVFYLPIMKQIGADECVMKSATFDELASVVDELLTEK